MTIRWSIQSLFLATTLALSGPAATQELRESLFSQTDAAFAEARAADVPLLSPGNFQEAAKHYARAEDKMRNAKSIERIRSDLAAANQALAAATEAARIARVTFATALESRAAAVTADAETLATSEWGKAEQKFDQGARRLENGDVNSARRRADDARDLYRQSELTAIQGAILNEARKLVTEARAERVERFAPETLGKAEQLIARAEADLTRNRYETEEPLAMAREAEYEARHARYLAAQVQRLKSKDVTPEDLILEWEQPLTQIAGALDTSQDLSAGYTVTRDASLARIADLQTTSETRAGEVEALTARVAELEESLGITTQRARASETRRRQVNDLEALFTREEARVLQEGDNVIIRLIGLRFNSGESVIQSQYFRLLRKIADVPGIFPGAALVVEGHTDAVGNDTMNLALSERRANSVRDYLLANTVLPASQISALGYGETRPIANNETAQGRAQNRRIDVVIVPPRA